ncbi:hypothetical protein SK128_001029 [Halocaridina rubra]|uniref:Secreted protein n=1 Tax=Halocaridina rubra TaxID=373956 RepID=A0AAN9AGM5_HALRR
MATLPGRCIKNLAVPHLVFLLHRCLVIVTGRGDNPVDTDVRIKFDSPGTSPPHTSQKKELVSIRVHLSLQNLQNVGGIRGS